MNMSSQLPSLVNIRNDVVRLYILEDFNLSQVKKEMKSGGQGYALNLTIDQWKDYLRRWGVFKNNCEVEARHILSEKERLGRTDFWDCLVIASGLLLDIRELLRYFDRKNKSCPQSDACQSEFQPRRQLLFVALPFNLSTLDDPMVFRTFRRLLWYATVHFDSCFDSGIWSPDSRGVYGRDPILVEGLTELSQMHNALSDAFGEFRAGKHENGGLLTRKAFELHGSIVKTNHHRQFPDILAVMYMIEREEGLSAIRTAMIHNLCNLANFRLRANDPRTAMFQTLVDLPLCPKGDLFLAFDAYCRRLWMSRAGPDRIKAFYSYNQAGRPRADPGNFFDLYKGKDLSEIESILGQIDKKFEFKDHARFCLWHTAIRYLLIESRNSDAEAIACRLVHQLPPIGNNTDYNLLRQFNLDASMTFYLHGTTQRRSDDSVALHSFETSVKIRTILHHDNNKYDAMLMEGLEALIDVARVLGDEETAVACEMRRILIFEAEKAQDAKALSQQ